ncbi:MAG: winged helix-turn-helix domain-containing protein [Pseudomonadota bacterium]
MLYRFDAFELDTETFELRQDGTAAHVEPLVFDLLRYFSENPGRVIGRDEIVNQVWQGRFVSDSTIAGCVKSARKALGDSGDRQNYIRTVRGRGFQFVGTVDRIGGSEALEEQPTSAPAEPAVPATQAAPPKLPSLAILPFAVFGDDDALTPVADGLADTLATILTRVPMLAVASRAASAAFKGQAISAPEVGQRLGVSYLLEGSVQALGDNIRANIQLIETGNGFHLWAQQFERPNDDAATSNLLQDILARLEPQLVRAIYKDQSSADGTPSSRQLLIQAMSILALEGWHTGSFTQAIDLLQQSVRLEPGLALAHAYLALILALGQRIGIKRASGEVVGQAIATAETAMRLDNMDGIVVGLAGCAIADAGQPERAIPILKNAIDLNPNNGHAWAALGSAQMLVGKIDEAVENLQRGVDISPLDGRLAVWNAILAMAYLMAGKPEQALKTAEIGCQNNDRIYLPRVVLTAIHVAANNPQEAAKALDECYRVKPDLTRNEIDRLVGRDLGAAIEALKAA